MIVMNDMKKLSAIGGPCLTILQPLRDEFSQVARADTRLNAAAQKAEELLIEKGFAPEARDRFLRPIQKIVRNTTWAGRTGSIVIFRAPGFTKASFWPEILDSKVSLSDEFFVLPLLAGLSSRHTFWVLALSINKVRLLRGTKDKLTEVDLPPTLPRNLIDAEGFAPPDHDLAGRSAGGGANGSVHFGTSSLHDNQPLYLRDFFKVIDRAIQPMLAQTGDPLVLAAVPRELAIYRDVNTYAGLLDAAIHGSPAAFGDHRLHEKALELLRASQSSLNSKSAKETDAAIGRGLLVTEALAIREAARLGQVEKLFVDTAQHTPDEDLINSAALAVIRNSGSVICGEAPGGITVAAILRYRAPTAEPLTPALLSV